jgi:hypothetical protein
MKHFLASRCTVLILNFRCLFLAFAVTLFDFFPDTASGCDVSIFSEWDAAFRSPTGSNEYNGKTARAVILKIFLYSFFSSLP